MMHTPTLAERFRAGTSSHTNIPAPLLWQSSNAAYYLAIPLPDDAVMAHAEKLEPSGTVALSFSSSNRDNSLAVFPKLGNAAVRFT
jgi:hypothetical protein